MKPLAVSMCKWGSFHRLCQALLHEAKTQAPNRANQVALKRALSSDPDGYRLRTQQFQSSKVLGSEFQNSNIIQYPKSLR